MHSSYHVFESIWNLTFGFSGFAVIEDEVNTKRLMLGCAADTLRMFFTLFNIGVTT